MNSVRLLCLSLTILVASPLFADTINFDTIDASAGDVILTSYQGYSFTNFSAYTTVAGFPGFNNGIVSGPNAAYSIPTKRFCVEFLDSRASKSVLFS